MYFGDHPLKNNWGLHLEAQLRREPLISRWEQLLVRTGVNYSLGQAWMGTLAYTYVRAYPPAGSTQIAGVEPRHSINQEIKQSQRVAGFTLENNVRLQQTYAGDRAYGQKRLTWKFLQRVHYRLGAEITAPSWFRSMPNYYAVYDEVIVGFGSHSGTNALKQDRTYGAFGWKLNQNTRLELGYMYQYRPVANGIIGEHNNALQISILSDAPIKHVFGLHR